MLSEDLVARAAITATREWKRSSRPEARQQARPVPSAPPGVRQAGGGASPITFSRRSRHFIANARVSSIEAPEHLGLALHVPLGLQHAVGDRRHLGHRARDRVAVPGVCLGHLAQEARAEGHVPVLVAGDLVEALAEAGQGAHLLVVLEDEVLPGEGEHPLDDHVVERDRLHQQLEVLRAARQAVHAALQHLVEELVELGVHVLARLGEPALERVRLEDAHLVVEAVEEAHVARLVGDLRAEEDRASPRSAPPASSARAPRPPSARR